MHRRGSLLTRLSPSRRLALGLASLVLTLGAVPAVSGAIPGTAATAARANDVTASQDALRTGWDPSEAGLDPGIVRGGTFQQLFRVAVDGQVYAQPVVVNGTVIVATENNNVYGLDAVTGAVQWTRFLGAPFVIANAPNTKLRACADLVPNIGVTGTPAYDPVTGDVYMFAKIMAGTYPKYYVIGINPATGTVDLKEAITGHPANDPSLTFSGQMQMQRPGVLIQGGGLIAAFGSQCDKNPYTGYVVRVDLTSSTHPFALWTDQSGATSYRAGIWQGGGGVMSDGPTRLFIASGNGISPGTRAGTSPGGQLAESVVKLIVSSTGKLWAKDFFSPSNAPSLDAGDVDLGSGGPVGMPFGTSGTSSYPHILAQAGKDGRIFLLNRDNLGGRNQGPGGTDLVLAKTKSYGGQWGHPAVFADTSTLTSANAKTASNYLYYVARFQPLRVFKFGAASSGKPTLSNVAVGALTLGYTSGSPVVTSNGSDPTTAVLWEVYTQDKYGTGGQLQAYDVSSTAMAGCTSAAPCSLSPIWTAPLGTAAKFAIPATSDGRVYVGTRDGHVYGFGVPPSPAVTAPAATFAPTGVSSTTVRQVSVTAGKKVTVTGVSTSTSASNSTTAVNEFTVGQVTRTSGHQRTPVPVSFPVTLVKGDKLHASVTFAPSAPGGAAGSLSFTTTSAATPSVVVPLTGSGTQTGLVAQPGTVTFPLAPDQGEIDVPVGITVPEVLTITNYGTKMQTVASVTPPSSPFSATGLPAVGTQIKPGESIAVQVTYAPTAAGPASGSFTITDADSSSVTVNLSGSGAPPVTSFTVDTPRSGAAAITRGAAPSTGLNFGTVKVGASATARIHVTNSGNQPSIITATTPLKAPFHAVYQIPAGLPFNPENELTQRVTFTPTKKGTFTAHYRLTWTDPGGAHTVTVTLTGTAA
jgi:outer membrane protein assembly factor BamB